MLDQNTLGIPVIAIGVPTVVDAATLVNDTMDCILNEMMTQTKNGSDFYKTLQSLEQEEKYQMITDILGPYTGNMFVTPKEVDAVIDRLANIIANSINIALHPGVTMEDINKYTF
jgi:spore protease